MTNHITKKRGGGVYDPETVILIIATISILSFMLEIFLAETNDNYYTSFVKVKIIIFICIIIIVGFFSNIGVLIATIFVITYFHFILYFLAEAIKEDKRKGKKKSKYGITKILFPIMIGVLIIFIISG